MGDRDRGTDPRFMIEGGSEPFDPKAESSKARQRVAAGKRKLANVLGIDIADLPGANREAWLVQLTDDPDAETVRRFRDAYGLRLTRRMSSLTFVERMDRKKAAQVRRHPSVRATVPYPPDLKLQTAGPTVSVAGSRFEIDLHEGDDLPAVSGMLEALGVKVVLANDETHAGADFSLLVETTQSTDLSIVAAIDDVAWIAEVGQLTLDNFDTAGVAQSGEPMSHPIWDKGLHGENMIIGVIDGGAIDPNSLFFFDSKEFFLGTPKHRKVLNDRRFGANLNLRDGHPTYICGCVAGDRERPFSGLHPNRGGAWAAKIAYGDAYRIFGDEQEEPTSTLLDELSAAAAVGARIHSNSWGADPKEIAVLPVRYGSGSAGTDDFLWRNEDHLFVVSAPNPGKSLRGGAVVAKNPIAVGGVTSANPNERHDDPRPLTADVRRKPDLLAVADGVITSGLTGGGTNPLAVTDGIRPNKDPLAGNSVATPHVAAAAALVRQYFMEGWYPNGKQEGRRRGITPSGTLLKAMLLNATVPLTGQPYPNERDGWGRLKLNRTLHFEGDRLLLWIRDVRRAEGLEYDGQVQTHTLTVPANAESMKVTLVFNDRGGDVAILDPVVNKLEIEVMEPIPSAFGYFGNNFFNPPLGFVGPQRPHSLRRDFTDFANRFPDPIELRNNVRQVLVDTPNAGRWTIVVRAHKIDQRIPKAELGMEPPPPWQGYALVASIDMT